MCILAYVTQFSRRFPFVLISNRDELLSRVTLPIGLDASTNVLWAIDGVAGGSWLGFNVRSGRFAVLTNCARSPTAPLRCDASCLPLEWRGAMPLAEVVRRTKVHATPADDSGTNVCLEFIPDISRGRIVRDFLTEGKIPGDSTPSFCASGSTPELSSLGPPYYDGYNLLTAESLYNSDGLQLLYTTNRYGAEHRAPTDHDAVHCLQNSHLDNWMEPKCVLLRERFQETLVKVLPTTGASPFDREHVATSFASSCLSLRPEFDLLREIQKGAAPGARLREYRQVLDASLPYNGYNGETELRQLYGAGLQPPVHFPTMNYTERANYAQRNIFLTSATHGTRTQTTVVVEKVLDGEEEIIVHFSQRECEANGAHKRWSHFSISSRGAEIK